MPDVERVRLEDGRLACRKSLRAGRHRCFAEEARGLEALAATATVPVPAVLEVGERHLLTEWIEPGPAGAAGWAALGERLADMHGLPQPDFGFEADNFCGDTPQPNPRYADGFAFFADQRLLYQARLAREAGLLGAAEVRRIESLAARLERWIPEQAPALIHGDLWGGNVLFDGGGRGWLIDPAAHRGWPEAELAMTTLFGEFGADFYAAYEARRPAVSGWRERRGLYNLYHLLNHLNLFGGAYRAQAMAVVDRYA